MNPYVKAGLWIAGIAVVVFVVLPIAAVLIGMGEFLHFAGSIAR